MKYEKHISFAGDLVQIKERVKKYYMNIGYTLNFEESNKFEFKRGSFLKSLYSRNIKDTMTEVSVKVGSGSLMLTYDLKPMGILLPEDEKVIHVEMDNLSSFLASPEQNILQEIMVKHEKTVGDALEATSMVLQPFISILIGLVFALIGVVISAIMFEDKAKIIGGIIGCIIGFLISLPISKKLKG